MGYYSDIRGAITFEPPLNNKELKALPPATEGLFGFVEEQDIRETDEGLLSVRSSCTIACRYEDSVKTYTAEEDLAALVRLLPGRTFSGEIRIEGAEQGDIQRLFVLDGEVVVWRAVLTWPDGSVEKAQ